MNAGGGIHLVINGDDFGMCHAVNVGVLRAFTEGVLTQASMMVPCPWFEGAAALARQHDLPVGVHLTATCEWDRYRWGPITAGRSLVAEDGRFHRTTEAVRDLADPKELEAEFVAQVELALARGLRPQYLDWHMVLPKACPEVLARVARRYGLPMKARPDDVSADVDFGFDSYKEISWEYADRSAFLRDHIGGLRPGWHLVNAHVAEDLPELDKLCSQEHNARPWAREYRTGDLKALLDPSIREAAAEHGAVLSTMGERPAPARGRRGAAS